LEYEVAKRETLFVWMPRTTEKSTAIESVAKAETAGRLAGALWQFWITHSHFVITLNSRKTFDLLRLRVLHAS
jgi:hypothetical protein